LTEKKADRTGTLRKKISAARAGETKWKKILSTLKRHTIADVEKKILECTQTAVKLEEELRVVSGASKEAMQRQWDTWRATRRHRSGKPWRDWDALFGSDWSPRSECDFYAHEREWTILDEAGRVRQLLQGKARRLEQKQRTLSYSWDRRKWDPEVVAQISDLRERIDELERVKYWTSYSSDPFADIFASFARIGEQQTADLNLFGLKQPFTQEQATAAYRRKVRECHHDKVGDDRPMAEVNAAWERLQPFVNHS
jgi:hypothetical protein